MGVKGNRNKEVKEYYPFLPSKPKSYTHSDLVEIAYKWVLNNASCGFAFKELSCIEGEIPDVIGFGSWNHSVLIEVKASRSDFLSDKRKVFRRNPERGMGKYRFYCCPTGLIKKEELPEKWGLIYVNEKGKARCVFNPQRTRHTERHNYQFNERNTKGESNLMYSALRRLHLRGRIPEIYNHDY